MRCRWWEFVLPVLVLWLGACKRPQLAPVEPVESEAPLLSTLHMADPAAIPQLLRGFYAVEQNAWRWTAREFVALLGVPERAHRRGGRLRLRFTVPEVIAKEVGPVKLRAVIGDTLLGERTYSTVGEQEFACDVPSELLTTKGVVVHFSLDKALPPGPVDKRELGVVALSLSLESK